MLRAFCFILLISISACAPRGALTILPMADQSVGTLQKIYIASNRQPNAETFDFSPARAETLSYARYDVSIPPNHHLGEIEWPRQKPVLAEHFVTTNVERFATTRSFTNQIRARTNQLPIGEREVTVFVHGYNTNFAEGLYRLAQISHDFENADAKILFSWPSAGSGTGYVYDRDSVIYARDGLVQLLEELTRNNVGRINLVAHSLGAFLATETLRQLSIKRQASILRRINSVVLLSPDIDVDVFRAQILHMDPLPKPFVVFASDQDLALSLSAFLTGREARLGSLSDFKRLADLDIIIIDVSNFTDADFTNHFTTVSSPALIKILKSMQRFETALSSDFRRNGRRFRLRGNVITLQPNGPS